MGPFETHDVITKLNTRIDAMLALEAELTARVDSLEDTVEELRYAGPITSRTLDPYDPDDLIAEEWDL